MIMYGVVHPKSDVDTLYIKRKEGGRGLRVWNVELEKRRIVWVFMLPIQKKTSSGELLHLRHSILKML